MNSIEKMLYNHFSLFTSAYLCDYLRSQFCKLDFVYLQSALKIQSHSLEYFVTSFIKAQQAEQATLYTSEKEDLFLYIACLLKLKLFTFAETVEFFIPRTLQRFLPYTLRYSFYNFKKNKKMSQLQVYLNYNFVDLYQLYQNNPDLQKRQFEYFFDIWVKYLQGDDEILQTLCPEVFKILSGEIQVQIPTAIQQLNEEAKITKNMRIYEMEQYINNVLYKRLYLAKNFELLPAVKTKEKRHEAKSLAFLSASGQNAQNSYDDGAYHTHQGQPSRKGDPTSAEQTQQQHRQGHYDYQNQYSQYNHYGQQEGSDQIILTEQSQTGKARNAQCNPTTSSPAHNAAPDSQELSRAERPRQEQNTYPYFPIPKIQANQIAQIFNYANSMTIPNPPLINLQNYTHNANFSTMTDIQSLSLLNNSTLSNNNSLLQNDFRSVINENTQFPRTEESDAQQNLVHALGGMEEVSMCLMQLGMHEKSESKY